MSIESALQQPLVVHHDLICVASALLLQDMKHFEQGCHGGSSVCRILVPVNFSPCSEEAFRIALSFGKLFPAEALLFHVVDTKSLDALNRLGLAGPSESTKQKRLNARQLLAWDEKSIRSKGRCSPYRPVRDE